MLRILCCMGELQTSCVTLEKSPTVNGVEIFAVIFSYQKQNYVYPELLLQTPHIKLNSP